MASQEEISCAFLFRQPFRDPEDSDVCQAQFSSYHEMQFSLQLLKLLSDIAFESDPTMKESLGFLEENLSAAGLSDVSAPTLPLSDLTTLSRALPEIMTVARNADGFATCPSEAGGEAAWSALVQAIAEKVPSMESSDQGKDLNEGWHDTTQYVHFDNLKKLFITNFDKVREIFRTFGDLETAEYETALRTEARRWGWSFRERTVEEEEKEALEEREAISFLADNRVFDEDSDEALSGGGYITILVERTEEPAEMSKDKIIGDPHL